MHGLYVTSGIFRISILIRVLMKTIFNRLFFLKAIFGFTGNPAVDTGVQKLLPRFCLSNLRKKEH